MQITKMLIPESNKFTRPGIKIVPTYICIHETDNQSAGADALAHAKLQQTGNSRQASWHFSVSSAGPVYQSVPLDEMAYHAGTTEGNQKSIAIELCVNADGDFTQTKIRAIELIRWLMTQFKIPIANIVPHQHWSGKNCPRKIISSGWAEFIDQVIEKKVLVSKNPYQYPGQVIKIGSTGSNVKLIQKELGVIVDGIFGKHTAAAVKSFQKACRLVQDSIVGIDTWNALFN